MNLKFWEKKVVSLKEKPLLQYSVVLKNNEVHDIEANIVEYGDLWTVFRIPGTGWVSFKTSDITIIQCSLLVPADEEIQPC